jgi:hypothetical protein
MQWGVEAVKKCMESELLDLLWPYGKDPDADWLLARFLQEDVMMLRDRLTADRQLEELGQ